MHIQAHRPQTSPFEASQAASVAAAKPVRLASAASASSSPAASTPSSTSTATITANDFLQLLVTELQNQDPTADTDPDEYVNQLVQVNSLQQQIQMNETMDGGPTLTGSSSGLLQELAQINQTLDGGSPASGSTNAIRQTSGGNLSVDANPANQKMHGAAAEVASALAPHSHPATGSGRMQAFEQFAAQLKVNQHAKSVEQK